MLKRIISAIIGLPFLVSIVFIGDIPLLAALLVISLIGLREFYSACKNKSLFPVEIVGYVSSILILVLIYSSQKLSYVLILFIFMFIVLSSIQIVLIKYNFLDVSITLYSIFYIPLLFSHILLISQQPNNKVIWLVFITAWATDTFAYFSGYFFGKRKLCPSISPKKTIEGAIGGVLGSMLTSLAFGFFFFKDYLVAIAIIGVFASIVAQLGDLNASLIKRYTGIKDFGNIMPGHGGVLDRFDSILFTAPTIYYFLIFIINKA